MVRRLDQFRAVNSSVSRFLWFDKYAIVGSTSKVTFTTHTAIILATFGTRKGPIKQ